MNGSASWIMANSYTEATAEEFGAVKGAPCTISNIAYDEDGNTVITFSWTNTEGKTISAKAVVKKGLDGVNNISLAVGNALIAKEDGLYVPATGVKISEDVGNALEEREDGLYVASSSGGGSSVLEEDLTSNIEVGGIASGKKYEKGTSLETIIKNLLVKYLAPVASLSLTPSTTPLINGTSVASTKMSVSVTKKSNPIKSIIFKVAGTAVETLTEGVADGGTFEHTYSTPITATTKFEVVVDDGDAGASANKTITFCDPTYYGTVADTVTSVTDAIIKSLTNKKAVNSKAMTYSDINMVYGKIVYAYPKSFGALTSIKDANNVDYIKSYTRTEVTVDGVVYYCYLLTDAAGVNSFKQIYA